MCAVQSDRHINWRLVLLDTNKTDSRNANFQLAGRGNVIRSTYLQYNHKTSSIALSVSIQDRSPGHTHLIRDVCRLHTAD